MGYGTHLRLASGRNSRPPLLKSYFEVHVLQPSQRSSHCLGASSAALAWMAEYISAFQRLAFRFHGKSESRTSFGYAPCETSSSADSMAVVIYCLLSKDSTLHSDPFTCTRNMFCFQSCANTSGCYSAFRLAFPPKFSPPNRTWTCAPPLRSDDK